MSKTNMGFAPMKKSSRAGKAGKNIMCPNCETISLVYHLSWFALSCQGCGEMIDKYKYYLETK
jgi:ribosomal protein S27E